MIKLNNPESSAFCFPDIGISVFYQDHERKSTFWSDECAGIRGKKLMRKRSLLLAAVLRVSLLAGCGSERETASSAASGKEQTLQFKELNVEIPKTDKTETQEDVLQAALQELPEKLKPALAAQGVKVNEIHVTIGSSCAATCQALASGNVNLAFLPADSFAAVKGGKAILAAGAVCPAVTGTNPSRWTGSYGKAEKRGVGNRALLCTSETEYGRNLAGHVSSGKKLTWNELDHARWGVLGTDSLAGYQCPELWLEDQIGRAHV